MLDIQRIRENQAAVEANLKRKDKDISLVPIVALDKRVREIKVDVEALKSERNAASKQIGELKRKGEDTASLMERVAGMGDRVSILDKELKELEERLLDQMGRLPNLVMPGVKVSYDVKASECLKSVGHKPSFTFPFKNHVELNEKLKLFDFERGAKLSGAGWPLYRGLGARLEWALINYMLQIHIKNGFEQWIPPLVARPEILFGSSQLPKFGDQVFRVKDEDYDLYLIPTAEVALNGIHYDEILPEEALPLKYTAYTPCFRREAGAAGSKERGLIRVHQFNKVEMFCFTKPEESDAMFEAMIESAEEVLQGLGVHYRNMCLVTGDTSFASAKTVDIEVWLPGQDRYYEVSSVSNCTDYQARRSATRFRREGGKPEFVHTLNGSGVATSRLMVAILENNQNADGSVTIPPVLRAAIGVDKIVPTH